MTVVWAGLAVGAVYALIAIGYNITLTFGGTFNFAHGALVVLAGFFSWFFMIELGWPWWLAALLGAVLCAVVAVLEERIAIRPVMRHLDSHALLVTTVGALVIIEGVLLATWGHEPHAVPFFGGQEAFDFLGGRVSPVDLWLIVVAIVVGVGFHFFARRSLWGVSARAATGDPDNARVRGINISALRTASFALAGGIAGLLGPIVVPKTGASVAVLITLTVFGFVALALGGFGSFIGALIGGFAIGLIQSFGARYLGVEFPPLLLFVVLLLVLLFIPSGLLGRRAVREV
ncbi:branched-chain amino acid ABC transporter permease [Microbacterium sp.]|uniref:branched-chain amino acid ABC transporter permease n=1 Tax=Microbacterium sp. TaxID=51671 RepID=UPI0037C72BA9